MARARRRSSRRDGTAVRRESEVFAFRWSVSVEGFYWIPNADSVEGLDAMEDRHGTGSTPTAKPETRRWLVECDGPETHWYEPLREEALFRTFADLYPAAERNVLTF